MKTKKETSTQVLTMDLREALKTIMQKEIQKLPEYIESLNNAEKLNFICKMMPFILPKTESVKHNAGEPSESIW
jgi:hypothetical protein